MYVSLFVYYLLVFFSSNVNCIVYAHMYVHSFSYLLNKLELGGYTYLQLKTGIIHNIVFNDITKLEKVSNQ